MQVYNLPLAKRNSLRIVFKGWRAKPKTFRTKGSLEASYFLEEKLKICLSDSELASAWQEVACRPLSQDVFGLLFVMPPRRL